MFNLLWYTWEGMCDRQIGNDGRRNENGGQLGEYKLKWRESN